MRDRFQFFPRYNFFNFFRPKGFVSYAFKNYDKKVVSYNASRKDIPVVLKALSRPAVLRLLGNLAPEQKLAFHFLSKANL